VDGLWYIGDAQEEAEAEKMKQFEKNFKNEPNQQDSDNYEHPELIDNQPDTPTKPMSPKKMAFKRATTISAGFFLSLKDGKTHLPKSKESMLSNIRKHLRGSSRDFNSSDSRDEKLKGLGKKKNSEESKNDDSDVESEASNFDDYDNFLRVTFKSDFLYQIGKVAAKSGYMLERALKFLNDFLLIINYYKQDMENKAYSKLRAHAIYYMGIAFFQLDDKEKAEEILRDIQTDLIEIHGKDAKKVKKVDAILAEYFTTRFNPMTQCITEYF
jgi:hypothetical protein